MTAQEDLGNLSNTELDRLITERVMGWTMRAPVDHCWCDSEGRAIFRANYWNPTTDAEHSARLLRHLRESGYKLTTHIYPKDFGGAWAGRVQQVVSNNDRTRAADCSVADDPNGFRCLCIAALRTYEDKENADTI